jgi:hypothetical protein
MISSSGNFANYLDELRNYEMCSLVVKPFKSVSQYLPIALETTQLSSSWLECFSLANEHTVFHNCYSSTVFSLMKTISLNPYLPPFLGRPTWDLGTCFSQEVSLHNFEKMSPLSNLKISLFSL